MTRAGLIRRLVWASSLLAFLCNTSTSAEAQTSAPFIQSGNMSVARGGHQATLLLDGRVLITGGVENFHSTNLDSAEVFDPDTGKFTPTGMMKTARSLHSATLLPDGRVLVAGGSAADTASAELYDPSTGTFIPTAPMVTPQSWHTATLLDNGKVLIAGGVAPSTHGNCCTAANPEIYDPSTGTFSAEATYVSTGPRQNPYGYGEWGLTAVPVIGLPDSRVLIAGEPVAELYNPRTGAFSVTGAMTTDDCGYNCRPWYIAGRVGTLLVDGRVLVAGGEHEDLGWFDAGELYDPLLEKFIAIGKMTFARTWHTITSLRDGTALIAGGQVDRRFKDVEEVFDSASGAFTVIPGMKTARTFHTATLLNDGRVLIAGGHVPGTNSATATAELYTPNVLIPASIAKGVSFNRSVVAAGSSYSVEVSGSNLTGQTFFDVRFTSPGSNESAVALNWQRGLTAIHGVDAGIASGTWTINGVRAHELENDHTSNFIPVTATITIVP
jgi:galactose oxidase-like protein